MTGIKGKYEFKTEKEGGPVFASDVLRKSIGLDLSSKLNGGRSSHSHPEELELVSPSIKRKIMMKDYLKSVAGHGFLEGFRKYLKNEAPQYLRSAEFSNYVQSFVEGKTSFYRADKLRGGKVESLVSKYAPVENEIKESFDNSSLNNHGLMLLDYYVDKLSSKLGESSEFTNEEIKIKMSPEDFQKELNSLHMTSSAKKAIFKLILTQTKSDNLVNKAFAEALKNSKGEDRKQLRGYFKYHNPYFLENQTMKDLSKLATDYFDNFVLEKDF